ncbi:MAG: hypothetical protein WBF66_07250 [Dehalococcoidia bacterium]
MTLIGAIIGILSGLLHVGQFLARLLLRIVKGPEIDLELRMDPQGDSGENPRRPDGPGHSVLWWGNLVLTNKGRKIVETYQVVLTLPEDIARNWSIGLTGRDNREGEWTHDIASRTWSFSSAGTHPVHPGMPIPIGVWGWMLKGRHTYQGPYSIKYGVAAEGKTWAGEFGPFLVEV